MTKSKTIKKMLIANRGEIAVRVMRTCHEMGIKTAVVFSEADRQSLPVQLADEAICIGPAVSAESYLNQDKIIAAAKSCGADAIHPGYGFLSENASFVNRCEKEGIIFVGPSAESMTVMGDKLAARHAMIDSGVPVIPGSTDAVRTYAELETEAKKIGFPVMIKASGGGGGKGIKIVHKIEDLAEAFERAQGEARTAVGDDTCYVEKYFTDAHHIEIQILGDQHGNAVYLGDRECSVQRRHQKVLEESPSPIVSAELRQRMGETAVAAVKKLGYYSSGTFEFMVDENRDFYFLEMNTRLQVEHTVTEMCTGIDLVKEQIRIAEGEALGYDSTDVVATGWAIELRINAEDPDNNFVPSIGKITNISYPSGAHVRFDSLLYPGVEISPYYDSMIGKLIVWAEDRAAAIKRMEFALQQLTIDGVKTTVSLHQRILKSAQFLAGNVTTNYLESFIEADAQDLSEENLNLAILTAVAYTHIEKSTSATAVNATQQTCGESAWVLAGRQAMLRKNH